MTEKEKLIFNCVINAIYDRPMTSKTITGATGIDRRMIAATVRGFNETYKGQYHIGSDKRGYWLCSNEQEAVASLLSYNQTILASLHERKKKKEQIRLTFGEDRDLFGQPVLSREA